MLKSKDIIGIYLKLEDKLTPVLGKVSKAYDRLLKHFDITSTKIESRAKKTMSTLGTLFGALANVSPGSGLGTGGAMKGGSGRQLKITLNPIMSKHKLPQFNQTNTRAMYKQMPQPWGYQGAIRFNKGGVVPGPTSARTDVVPGLLTPGEVVLPRPIGDFLKKMALNSRGKLFNSVTGKMQSPKDLDAAIKYMKRYERQMKSTGIEVFGLTRLIQNLDLAFDIQAGKIQDVQGAMEALRQENHALGQDIRAFQLRTDSLWETLDRGLGAVRGVIAESATFGLAAKHGMEAQEAFREIRLQMDMTDATATKLKKSVFESMAQFGTSFEDAVSIVKHAALAKIAEKDFGTFIKTASEVSLALRGMGVDADQVSEMMLHDMNKLGVSIDDTRGMFSALIKVTQKGFISFHDLSKIIESHETLWLQLASRGVKLREVIAGIAGAAGAMKAGWIDATHAVDFLQAAMDPSQWGENIQTLNSLLAHTNGEFQTFADIQDALAKGRGPEVMAKLAGAMAEVSDNIVRMGPEMTKAMTGFNLEDVMQAKKAVDNFRKAQADLGVTFKTNHEAVIAYERSLVSLAKQSADESNSQAALNKAMDDANKTLLGSLNRLSATWKSLMLDIGPWLADAFSGMVDAATGLVGLLKGLNDLIPDVVKKWGAWAIAIGVVYNALKGIGGLLLRWGLGVSLIPGGGFFTSLIGKGLTMAVTTITAALGSFSAALSNPITLGIALGLAFGALLIEVDKSTGAITKMYEAIGEFINNHFGWLTGYDKAAKEYAEKPILDAQGKYIPGSSPKLEGAMQQGANLDKMGPWGRMLIQPPGSKPIYPEQVDKRSEKLLVPSNLQHWLSPASQPTSQPVPGYADGGVVTKPTLAMVGEAGPEAIVPLSRYGGDTDIHVKTDNTGVETLLSRVVDLLEEAVRTRGPDYSRIIREGELF